MYFSNKYKYKFCCLKLFLELLQTIEQLAAIGSGTKSEMLHPSSKRCEVILYDKKVHKSIYIRQKRLLPVDIHLPAVWMQRSIQ